MLTLVNTTNTETSHNTVINTPALQLDVALYDPESKMLLNHVNAVKS